jgi:hypothetical protein
MAKQFVILCSAQRLPYQDGDATGSDPAYFAFGLNLTAAIGVPPGETPGVTAAEAMALRPWTWARITQVQAATAPDGLNSFACPVIELPAAPPDIDRTALLDQLNRIEYNPGLETDLDGVTAWPLPLTTKVEKSVPLDFKKGDSSAPGKGGRRKRWHASILQLSTYPYPIPQLLNLSFIVKVPRSSVADPNAPLFLAPIIPDATIFAAATKPTGALETTGDSGRGVFRWKYDKATATGLEVAAYLLPTKVNETPPLSGTVIDLTTGWVKNAGVFEEDWLAYFEQRAGEAFDMGERLINYMRDHVTELRDEPRAMPFFQKAVISVLRDTAGTGLLPSIGAKSLRQTVENGPTVLDDNTLADDLLGPNPADKLTKAEIDRLRSVERALFGIDSQWRRFLAQTLPQVSGLRALSVIESIPGGPPPPPELEVPRPVEDCLSDLEQLHKALLDPQNLHVLVQAQWELIFKQYEEEETQAGRTVSQRVQRLRTRIASLKADFDFRKRLARSNLGPVWNALRREANRDIARSLDIGVLIPSLIINHLQARLKLDQTEAPTVMADEYFNYLPVCDARNEQPTLSKCNGGTTPTLLLTCVVDDLKANSKAKLLDITRNLRPPSGPLDQATDVPHSVSLQAHLTTMRPNEQTAFDDVLNQVSGALVFLRDRRQGLWFCLNFARANVRGSAMDKNNLLAVPSRLNYQNDFSQSLITYNNVPLAARSPLSDIPRVQGNGTVAPEPGLVATTQDGTPLIRYDYSTDPRAKIKALIFRDAGEMYDAVVAVVTASGALPAEISVPSRPWEINPAKLNALDLSARPEYVRTFTYTRKVRVGEIRTKSTLRQGLDDSARVSENLLRLPKIPDKVYPRALELPPEPPAEPGGQPRILSDDIPLLLLAPQHTAATPNQRWGLPTSFQFPVRKPATDVETWHRWVNDGNSGDNVDCSGPQNNRVCLLANYYERLDVNRKLPRERSAFDVSIDDPAVSGFLAELRHFNIGTNRWEVLKAQAIPKPPPTLPKSLADVQSDPLTVTCQSADTADLTVSGSELKVNCVRGEIYWLLVHATITRHDTDVKKDDSKRFAPVVAGTFKDIVGTFPGVSGTDIRLAGRPLELLIEVATPDFPSEAEIWRSLRPEFIPTSRDNLGDRVEVSLESRDTLFRHVYRAELQRQTWYWQGRETAPFPSLPRLPFDFVNPDLLNTSDSRRGPGLSAEVRRWEEFEFAAREDTDFTILDFKRASDVGDLKSVQNAAAGGANPQRWFTYAEQLTPATATANPSRLEQSDENTLAASGQPTSDGSREKGDLRSHYYRFSAEVFSRYEGVIPPASPRSRRAKNPQTEGQLPDGLAKWRRLFVPCRRTELPPVPKIKLILPLTESFIEHDATRSPGLLVVLDEPWYEYGGLGEGFAAEVETLADPHNPSEVQPDPCPIPGSTPGKRFHFELGPDPILAGHSDLLPQSDSTNPAGVSTVSLGNVRGPVGHTHDEIDTGALFTATSFIVPAPKIEKTRSGAPTIGDVSWYMSKIRLRRQMRLKGALSPDPLAVLRSDLTEGQWVQYLPEFSLFADGRKVEDLYITASAAGVVIRNNSDNREVSPAELSGPVEAASNVFSPVLLLTRSAFNASGERNQEVYVGVCWPNADNKTWGVLPETDGAPALIAAGLLSNPDVHFQARVLGIQGVPTGAPKPQNLARPASSREFFDSLFAATERDEGKVPISDVKRPRIVRISRQISDVRRTAPPRVVTDDPQRRPR